jgi:hypothetical protein
MTLSEPEVFNRLLSKTLKTVCLEVVRICLWLFRPSAKNISQDSQHSGRHMKRSPAQEKSDVSPLGSACMVIHDIIGKIVLKYI